MLGLDFKPTVYYIYRYNKICSKYVSKFKLKYKLGVETSQKYDNKLRFLHYNYLSFGVINVSI